MWFTKLITKNRPKINGLLGFKQHICPDPTSCQSRPRSIAHQEMVLAALMTETVKNCDGDAPGNAVAKAIGWWWMMLKGDVTRKGPRISHIVAWSKHIMNTIPWFPVVVVVVVVVVVNFSLKKLAWHEHTWIGRQQLVQFYKVLPWFIQFYRHWFTSSGRKARPMDFPGLKKTQFHFHSVPWQQWMLIEGGPGSTKFGNKSKAQGI